MNRDHAPGALHHHLHQKGADREPYRAGRKRPERKHEERKQRSDNDDAPSAEAFGQTAKRYSSDNGADVVDDRYQADLMRTKAVLDLQKSRVKVLSAVAEEIERGHQQDRVNAEAP